MDSEREKLLERIRAGMNNKRAYAIERLYAHMCCCEDYAVPRLGEEADAERIHYRKLTMRYHDVLSTSPVEIFYCGSLEGGRVARILTDVLSTMPRGEIDEDIGTDIRMNALEAEPRYVTETLPVAQGQLAVGYRLGACMTEPDIPALFVFNALYGGCVTSKLFLNVREKLSLCYYVGSRLSTHKGLLTVTSGIDVKNYERALAEITAQLDAVRTGDFTDGALRHPQRGQRPARHGRRARRAGVVLAQPHGAGAGHRPGRDGRARGRGHAHGRDGHRRRRRVRLCVSAQGNGGDCR